MGVQGLWKLVESTGRPVNLEALEGKVLAVDVSIWLNQAVLGVHGSGITNPHLQVLFNRICKLLFYRIKPIFVFDGAPPQLKKQTLAARRQRKDLAASRTEKTTERLVKNYLKSHAIQAVIAETGEGTSKELPPLYIPRKNETDLYELPPLPSTELNEENSGSEEDEEEDNIAVAMAAHQAEMSSSYQDLGEVDIESESFKSLPIEVQHELIAEIQESSKKNSWARMHQLPKASQDFSQYQLKKLMNKSKLSLRLDDLRKEMRTKMSLSMTALLDAQSQSSQVDAGRVASEDTQHYILMKKGNKPEESSDNESDDELVVASYAERAGFATSMDLKMEKAMRKRGTPTTTITTSSAASSSQEDGSEVVVIDDDSIPARKKRRIDLVSREMNESEAVISNDKESKTEAVKAELKKFFDQLDAKISPSKKQTVHSSESTQDVMLLEEESTSKAKSLSEPTELNSSKSETARTVQDERTLEDVVVVDDDYPESDMTLKERTVEKLKSRPLERDMSDPVTGDKHAEVQSTECHRTAEFKDIEFKTEEERCEVASSSAESMTKTLQSTVEKKIADDQAIADPARVDKQDDHNRTMNQRRDILKELQKKKEDMKNMLKSFESRMEDFNIPDIPGGDSANDAEFSLDVSADTSSNIGMAAESHGATCDDVVVDATPVDEVTDTETVNGVDRAAVNNMNDIMTVPNAGVDAKTIVDAVIASKDGTDAAAKEKNDTDPGKRVVVEITLDRPLDGPLQEIGQKTEVEATLDTSDISFMTRSSLDTEWTTSGQTQIDSDDDIQKVYLQESDQEPEIGEWQGVCVEKMNEMDKKLQMERIALEKERRKQQKKSYSITDTMYADSKELLQCFGIPYIESPQEAEAQCAFLDLTNQTEGTITDDSDIWLFGGHRVFRHFFSKKKDPEFFRVGDIERHLLLDRKKLINLAYLVGSDYTLGIQGVGSVGAMEIMGEFKGQGLKTLKAFKSWWTRNQDQILPSRMNAIRSKWCKLILPDEFPNPLVAQAYMSPVIDESDEGFQWGLPDLGLIRDYAREKFGWMKTKVDENLLPVLKRLNDTKVQSKMTSFFGISHLGNKKKIASKRMRNALMQMERSSDEEEESEEEEEERPKKKKRVSAGSGKKRVRRKKKVPQQEGGEEKDKGVQKAKKRVKRKKKVMLGQNDDDTVHDPKQGKGSTENAEEIPMSEEDSDFTERKVKKRKVQNGKVKNGKEEKPKPEASGRQKRNIPEVDYTAMMADEHEDDIPDEALLDVAEDMEMAALMEDAGSGHNVTKDLRNISSSGSSQPKTRSLNSSLDMDFVEERMGKGRGGRRGKVVPQLSGGGSRQRGKGKRGGAKNKGKALMKKRPVQMDGPNLSSSGSDSD